jgi:phospholipid/cholesterol/gamma-HCH transport system substrate-binding protein
VKRAISKNLKEFLAIVVLALIAAIVGGYILTHQRLTLPGWVPGIGTEFTQYKAALSTAQSVTPGQGQTVQIAGVDVGELTKVELVDGRGIVSMKVDPDHPFYRDASAMLRPKTGLNDMVLQVDPGTRAAGEAPEGFTIPVDRTLPNVNLDQFLSALDADTRASLQLLLGGAGQALRGQGRELSNTLRRFEPLGRDVARLTSQLQERSRNIKRSVRNFRLLATELGSKDDELAAFIDANNAVFRAFANQDARLRETLRELPSALRRTSSALAKVQPLGTELRETLGDLRPFARDLGPALRATRPFLRETRPIIRTQLRPFARDAQPAAKLVRSSGEGLTEVTPDLRTSLNVVNYLANELAYNPRGPEEGYLFWFAWSAHLGNSIFNMQDAHGVVRRAVIVGNCFAIRTAEGLAEAAIAGAPLTIGTLAALSDTPKPAEVGCPPADQGPTE